MATDDFSDLSSNRQRGTDMPPRSSQYAEDWRSRPARPSRGSLRLLRAVATALVVLFLAVFVGLLIWSIIRSRVPTLHIACLPLAEFHSLVADPITFARRDADALQQVCAADHKHCQSYCAAPNSEANEVRTGFLKHLRDCQSDVLVCAVWARPLSDSPQLVFACSNLQASSDDGAQPAKGSKTLPLGILLEALAASPATHRILVLDAGRGLSTPYAGMPVLDLAERVKTELSRVRPEKGTLWVLLASSSLEQSQVLPAAQQSVFYHFFTEALRGQADGIKDKKDQKVDLDEVAEYVRQQVSACVWSQSNSARMQTPQLLPGPGASLDGAGKVVMRILPKADVNPTPTKEGDAKTEPGKPDAPAEKDASVQKNSPKAPPSTPTDSSKPGQTTQVNQSPASDRSSATATASAGTGKTAAGTQPTAAAKPDTAAKPETAEAGDIAGARPKAAELDKLLAKSDAKFPRLNDILRSYWNARYQPLSSCPDVESKLSGWTPVDYAPHLVRRFEEALLSYQGRAISEPPVSQEKPVPQEPDQSAEEVISKEIAGATRDRQAEYCRMAGEFQKPEILSNWEQLGPFLSVIRDRNLALFELPYYIRLQTQLPNGVSERDYYNDVEKLIQRLERLTQALAGKILKRTGPGGSEIRLTVLLDGKSEEDDLARLARDVQDQREKLREILGLKDGDAAGLQDKDPLFLFDLLATPLVSPVERARIWSQLLAGVREKPSVRRDSPPPEAQVIQSRQRAARNQLVLRAQLACKALAVTCSDADERSQWEKNIETLRVAARKDDAALAEALVQVGQEIRRREIELVKRVPGVDGVKPTVRGEVALRLLPAWLAEEVEADRSRWDSIAATLDFAEVEARIVISPPTGADKGPLPLSPQENLLPWHLKSSARAIPPRLKLIFDYPEDLLQVTGHGQPLRKGVAVDWRTDSREECPLPIQVRPLKEDGSKARLTISLPDYEGCRASADLQLPEPTLLDLSVTAQAGTFSGEFRAPVADAKSQDPAARWLHFDASGYAKLTLQPHPSAPTPYRIAARNLSSRDWPVKSTVWIIPADVRERGGQDFRPRDASSATPPPGYIVQAQNEWTIRAGETKALPLFPSSAAAATEPAAKPTDAPAAKPSPPVPEAADVTGGILCLLELPKARQLLFIDMQIQHPDAYLQPEVDYNPDEQRVRIRLKAANPELLPPGNCRIRWEISPKLQSQLVDSYLPPEINLRSKAPAELSARLNIDPTVQRSIPVVISVDGYPRAFEYERPLSIGDSDRKLTSRLNAQVVLVEIDETGGLKRDERGNLVQIPPGKGFSKLERLGVVFLADTPRVKPGDSDFRLRVFLKPAAGSGDNAAVGESQEFYRDRSFSVKLEKPEEPESTSNFVLRSRVDDLSVVLRTGSFQNQEIVVCGEIDRLPRGGGQPELVKSAEPQSVWHDDRPPKVLELRNSRIDEGSPLTVEVAQDPTGITELWYAQALDPATNKMVEPKKAQRQTGTKVLATFLVPSEGLKPPEQAIYLAATDGAGNTGEPSRHVIQIVPKPPKPEPAKPELKKIVGSVTYRGVGMEGWSVTLRGPSMPPVQDATSGQQGKFEFDDLPPGKYRLQVKPEMLQGVIVTADKQVDLTGPEPTATVDLPLAPR